MKTLVLTSVLLAGTAWAQETLPTPTQTPSPLPTPSAGPRRPPTAMHVQIVVTRTRDAKPVSRLPYTMTCIADGGGRPATLRMGVEVPVAVGGGKGIQYRNVGTNIDVSCDPVADGLYRVKIALEYSSLSDPGRAGTRPRAGADAADELEGGNPMFRTFNSTFTVLLRDQQGALSTAATDPVTGEDVTIEAGLKLLR